MLCFKRWCFKDTKFKGKCQMTDLKCSDVLTRETFFWGGQYKRIWTWKKEVQWRFWQILQGESSDSNKKGMSEIVLLSRTFVVVQMAGLWLTIGFSAQTSVASTLEPAKLVSRARKPSPCVFSKQLQGYYVSCLLRHYLPLWVSTMGFLKVFWPEIFDLYPPPYVCCVSSCQGFQQWD